jgi:predicted AlkP superfamily phosphohydrolase/phosphomutase
MKGGQLQRMAAARALALWRKLPLELRTRVKQRLGGLRERSYELQNFSIVDFERTKAFAYGTFGNIVINVQGRERNGIVAPGAEYEAVRDEIAKALRELRDPATGRPIVAAVHKREELHSGPQIERVPDLVVEFVDYEWLGKGNLKSRTETIWDRVEISGTTAAYVGSHRHEGIVALSGPSAAPGGLFASIEDIAPTIQYLLGEPIPESMEGQLIDAAIDPDLLERRPPEYAADDVEVSAGVRAFEDNEAGDVQERLRGLGYIE